MSNKQITLARVIKMFELVIVWPDLYIRETIKSEKESHFIYVKWVDLKQERRGSTDI